MVNDQMKRIKSLRDLLKNVDQVLPQTTAAVDAQVARIGPAKTVVSTLTARFAAENIAAVAGNPDAAGTKLDAAKASLAAATTALAAGDRDTAVQQVQAAETTITEATAQLDAVDATQAALTQNETQLTASIAAVQQDVTQARAALSAGKGTDRAADVDRAAALLAQAQALAAATPLDVVGATRAATEANTVVDACPGGHPGGGCGHPAQRGRGGCGLRQCVRERGPGECAHRRRQRVGGGSTRPDPGRGGTAVPDACPVPDGHRSRDRGPGITDSRRARRRGDRRDPGEYRRAGRHGRHQLGRPAGRLRLALRRWLLATIGWRRRPGVVPGRPVGRHAVGRWRWQQQRLEWRIRWLRWLWLRRVRWLAWLERGSAAPDRAAEAPLALVGEVASNSTCLRTV